MFGNITYCFSFAFRFLIGLEQHIKTGDMSLNTILLLVPVVLNILITTKKMKVLSNWWTLQEPWGPCMDVAGSSEAVETSVEVLETKEAIGGPQPITRIPINFKFWAKLKRTKKGNLFEFQAPSLTNAWLDLSF